jgi:poly-beta-1,6-N-acetyl-D-glucosamine N-deacetylase
MMLRPAAALLLLCTAVRAIPGVAADNAVILQYHHVAADTPRVTSVNADEFRAHLAYLRNNGFTVLPLERIVTALRDGEPLPDRAAAITFDDGYRNNYDTAYPILREYGWPFTLFVSSELVGSNARVYLDWDELREMAANGATIANHGLAHAYLLAPVAGEDEAARLARIERELLDAEATIARETGQNHKLFAYPFGEYDRAIQDLVTRIGFTGLGQQSGPVSSSSDFSALPRFPFSGIYTALDTFAVKVNSLAFSVTELSPQSPVTAEPMPEVVLDFDGDYRYDALNCFNNNAPMRITAENIEGRIYRIAPVAPNTTRRFRYNCTAPAGDGRFYWYTVTWVNPALDDN